MSRDRDWGFAAIVGLILLVEAILIIPFAGDRIIGVDGLKYALYARNLVEHGVYSPDAVAPYDPSIYRTPGYPLFLAGLRVIGGDSVDIVRIAQFLLLGLLAWLVYGIGREIGNVWTARVAALICATYLPLLWIARMHLTETVTSVLITAVVLLLLQGRADPRPWRPAAVGALIACAALVRPSYALAIVPVAIGMVIWRERLPWRTVGIRLVALGVAFVVLLIPWTIRNLSVTDQIRPFGVGGGGTSLLASAMEYSGQVGYRWGPEDLGKLDAAEQPIFQEAAEVAAKQKSDVPLSVREEIEADRLAREKARDIFDSLSASQVLKSIPKREAYLWAVSDYPPESHHSLWHNLARLQHFALLLFALVGIVVGLMTLGLPVLWPVFLFPAYLTLLHLYVHSEGRYSLPVRPALMAMASLGLVWAWGRLRPSE